MDAYVLDTMVYDALLEDDAALAAFTAPERPFRVLAPMAQVRQLEHPNTPPKVRALLVFAEPVLTTGAYWGDEEHATSHWGEWVWASEEEGALMDAIVGDSKVIRKRMSLAKDALIAATAMTHGAVLVTEDGTLCKRARGAGRTVWRWRDFRAVLIGTRTAPEVVPSGCDAGPTFRDASVP